MSRIRSQREKTKTKRERCLASISTNQTTRNSARRFQQRKLALRTSTIISEGSDTIQEAPAEILILFMIMEVSMPFSSPGSKINPPHFYLKSTVCRTPRKSTHPQTAWLSQSATRAMVQAVTHMPVPVMVDLLILVCLLSSA